MCGDDGKKVTPVPISNTEVKLLSADCSEGFPFVRLGHCRACFYINIQKVVDANVDGLFCLPLGLPGLSRFII